MKIHYHGTLTITRHNDHIQVLSIQTFKFNILLVSKFKLIL